MAVLIENSQRSTLQIPEMFSPILLTHPSLCSFWSLLIILLYEGPLPLIVNTLTFHPACMGSVGIALTEKMSRSRRGGYTGLTEGLSWSVLH